MKNAATLIFLILAVFSVAFAQDIITLKNGEEMKAHIIRLNRTDVTFIPVNSVDTAYLLREDVTKLHYKSGIIIFLTESETPELFPYPENDSLYILGKNDASLYYKGYTAAAAGTLVTSIFFPWGLIPAIACSSKPPSRDKLGYQNQQLIENPGYYNGYVNQAHKIKKKKVWGGFAIGSGIYIGLVAILSVMAVETF